MIYKQAFLHSLHKISTLKIIVLFPQNLFSYYVSSKSNKMKILGFAEELRI